MAKTPPSEKVPQWSTARYFQFIRSALRAAWNKYPVKYAVIQQSRKEVEGKRHRWEYQCKVCDGWFQQKEVQVDHIVSAGTLKEYKDLPKFVENLFCGVENLQILCKPCHMEKTLAERKANKEDVDGD